MTQTKLYYRNFIAFSFMGIVPLGAQAEEINQLETINVSATAESKTLAGKDEGLYVKIMSLNIKAKKKLKLIILNLYLIY